MLNWLNATWLAVASACLTLAVVHARAWFRRREAREHAAFVVLTLSVAAMGLFELGQFNATTIEEYQRLLWWYQLPVWSGLVAVVWFVRLYLRAGSLWLGWAAVGLRTLALAVNAVSSPSINFTTLIGLEKVDVLGVPVSIAQGTTNPWMLVAHLSLLFLLLFVASAMRELWRRGDRRRAVTICGSLLVFVGAGTVAAVSYNWGFARFPTFAAPYFLPIVIAMGFELGLDVVRTAQLSDELSAKDAALRGSERQLELAVEGANVGLWSIDRATGRVWATPRALAMFGLAPEQSYRLDDLLQAIHADDRERVRSQILGPPRAGGGATTEYRVAGTDGSIRWLASRGGPGEGASQSVMGVTVDITERKRAEDEAARQRAQLEHLSRVATLTELSGTLAHELNQPLAIIMSNAEAGQLLLERPTPDLAEVRAILADIIDADERAGEVIKRLRSMLKGGTPSRKPLLLNALVQDVLAFMRADLIRRGATVETALDDSLPAVYADRVPIEQVLINLIGNACDAMAGNAAGDRPLRIATRMEAGSAQVRITDAGSGLPAAPERAFEAFYTTKAEGLGLGLAISKSIVTAHGGRLSAEHNQGRGATFTVSLPLAQERA